MTKMTRREWRLANAGEAAERERIARKPDYREAFKKAKAMAKAEKMNLGLAALEAWEAANL